MRPPFTRTSPLVLLAACVIASPTACSSRAAPRAAPEVRPVVVAQAGNAGALIPSGQRPAPPPVVDAGPPANAAAQGEVRRLLYTLTTRFTAGYTRAMLLTTGSLAAAGNQQYALPVEAHRCYRVFGASTASASDLDLFLSDASGAEVESDLSYGTTAMLGFRQPLCFDASGVYKLEVRLVYGPGSYGVEVFSAPESTAPQPSPWGHTTRHHLRGVYR